MDQSVKETNNHWEVILAGAGGQGLILSAVLLGEGAIREGKNVVQTQSYGIAARGGLSIAEVIIASGEIVFQQVQKPDVVLALTDKALEQFGPFAEKGSLIFYDTTHIGGRKAENFRGFPFMKAAADMGHRGAANLIALGAMIAGTGMIRMDSIVRAVSVTFPDTAAAVNIEALRLGESLVTAGPAEGDS